MDFEKICMVFTMQEPFYGILLSSMLRKPEPSVGTIGVGRTGNVFTLFYNDAWVKSLTLDQALAALKHECLHLAFNHFSIWEDQNPTPAIQKIRNIAADLEVNSYLDSNIVKSIKGCLASDFGWASAEGTREYFSRLIDMVAKNKPKQNKQKNKNPETTPKNPTSDPELERCDEDDMYNDDNYQDSQTSDDDDIYNQKSDNDSSKEEQEEGSHNHCGQDAELCDEEDLSEDIKQKSQSFDDHTKWPRCDKDEADQIEQIVEDMLVMAAEETEKGCGSIPGEMRVRVDAIRNKKRPKPVADWKRYCRRYLGNEFSELIRKSKKRESRRFPDAAGNRHRRKSHILVAIDTSGSVSMPEYLEFFGHILTMTKDATFHVVECDSEIQYEYDFTGKPNMDLHGGGGTWFEPVTDMFIKNRKQYDSLVYFTDGECEIPKNTPKDTLWVISSKGDQSDRQRYRVNGASVAFIPKQN